MMQPLTGNPAQSTHRVIRRHRTWQTVHWTIAPVRCVNITNAIQFVSKQPTRQLKQLREQQIDSSSRWCDRNVNVAACGMRRIES